MMNVDVESAAIREAAERWLVKIETSATIEPFWKEFRAWLEQDPRHQETYLELERAWHAFDGLGNVELDEDS